MTNPLERLNPRERTLLFATVAVLALGALFFAGRTVIAAVRGLDDRIADRELEVEQLTQQNAQASAVNAAYASVVKVHSSAFTVAEIHDNLRREVMRLAQVEFPATAEKPARTMYLVRIPALEEGQITQGEGHRDYQIRFQIPVARLEFLLAFLERIEASEQLLRIDNIEIARAPDAAGVQATVEITRTVLDDPEGADATPVGGAQ